MSLFLEHLTFSQLPDVYRLLLQRLSIKRYHFQQKIAVLFVTTGPPLQPSQLKEKKKGRRFFFARARSRLGDAAPAIHSAREGVFPVEPKGTAGTAPRRHHEEHMEIRQASEVRAPAQDMTQRQRRHQMRADARASLTPLSCPTCFGVSELDQ